MEDMCVNFRHFKNVNMHLVDDNIFLSKII
jgi:hypothetical protein